MGAGVEEESSDPGDRGTPVKVAVRGDVPDGAVPFVAVGAVPGAVPDAVPGVE